MPSALWFLLAFFTLSQFAEEVAEDGGAVLTQHTAHQLRVVWKILHKQIQHAAAGTHDELIASSSIYQEVYYSQEKGREA
jgi:hypothetical protein